jgi:hypothetical protein
VDVRDELLHALQRPNCVADLREEAATQRKTVSRKPPRSAVRRFRFGRRLEALATLRAFSRRVIAGSIGSWMPRARSECACEAGNLPRRGGRPVRYAANTNLSINKIIIMRTIRNCNYNIPDDAIPVIRVVSL